MLAWWDSLTLLEQGLAMVAIPATVILAIQTVLLIIGIGGASDGGADGGTDSFDIADDFDGDADGDFGSFDASAHDGDVNELAGSEAHSDPGLSVFTIRGFVAFFTVFGWLALAMLRSGVPPIVSLTAGLIAGSASMLLMAYMFKWMLNLQSSGNIDMQNALGRSGSVYIRVPAGRRARGKVTLVVQGKFSEMDAVTEDGSDLMPGEEVTVVGVSNQDTLLVTRKKGY